MKFVPWDGHANHFPSAPEKVKRYYKYWLAEYKKGNHIEDINAHVSYVFVYVYALIRDFLINKNINTIEIEFSKILEIYRVKSIQNYVGIFFEDAYLYIRDYQRALQTAKKYKTLNRAEHFIFYRGLFGYSIQITREEFIMIVGKRRLTKFGNDNLNNVVIELDKFLKDFHEENGMNFIDYFCKDYFKTQLRGFDKINYREKISKIDDLFFTEEYDFPSLFFKQQAKVFFSYNHGETEIPAKQIFFRVKIIDALYKKGWQIIRDCENIYRIKIGVHKIGEGWISETALYHRLTKEFPEEKIIHHGKPEWLGKQHLDIYFPKYNIGIEYQGEQHLKPIEFFGREEAYKKVKLYDEEKRIKCMENDCQLIYIYNDYNIDLLVKKLSRMIIH